MDLVEAAARNMAGWHDWQLRTQGLECRYSDSLWSCREKGPGIYLSAITLSPESTPDLRREVEELVAERPEDLIIVSDSWLALDLSDLGFKPDSPDPVYARPPGDTPTVSIPSDLLIERVTDAETLEAFEEASVDGFGSRHIKGRSRWHVPETLDGPNMSYYAGYVGDEIASVSIACVSDGVVGIYGVATKPEYRRRGYGAAMTWRALRSAPELPAVLEPSNMAAAMYRKMGFDEIGHFRHWKRTTGQ